MNNSHSDRELSYKQSELLYGIYKQSELLYGIYKQSELLYGIYKQSELLYGIYKQSELLYGIYKPRWITPFLASAIKEHPIVVLTGARQVGKSMLNI